MYIYEQKNLDGRIEDQTDSQTKILHTFHLCYQMLKKENIVLIVKTHFQFPKKKSIRIVGLMLWFT